MKNSAVPLLARLMRYRSNTSKLDAAKILLRVITPVFAGEQQVITLVDGWYMEWPYLRYVLEIGFSAIGQVRRDTALYDIPVLTGKRCRPRKYGEKFTAVVVATLPEVRKQVFLYSKKQWVRYRSAVCLAKFMCGYKVRAVWVQFEDKDGNLSKQRLILSTLCDLTAEEIFIYYAKRWSIEDLFNQLKNRWGWWETWQQSRQVLHRWTQIVSIAYVLPQLLSIYCGDQVEALMHLTPWKKTNQVTAGRVRLGLQMILGNVRVRDWWNPTCRKFQLPEHTETTCNKVQKSRIPIIMMSKNKMTEKTPPLPN